MQHLNYSRQFLVQCANFSRHSEFFTVGNDWDAFQATAGAVSRSQKFTLPENGKVLDDVAFRGLEEHESLNLPFLETCLEFRCPENQVSKNILLLRQTAVGVSISPVLSLSQGVFVLGDPFSLLHGDFIDRQTRPGVTLMKCVGIETPTNTYAAQVVLGFLNALACSNVAIERGPAPKQGAKVKGGIPFDTYHTLVLRRPKGTSEGTGAGGHRSPREHLRRGHVRRLESGDKVWVNATVVNAGAPGKVIKDYKL